MFYRETTAGGRFPVTRDQWNIDRFLPTYQQVIAQPGLTIYRVNL